MKTKFFATMMAAVMTMAMISGCGVKANAMDNEKADMIVGGWSTSDSSEITDDVKTVFDKATKDLTGVDYQPVAYLGSQVVAGTNHAILCRANIVVPDAKPYYTIMYIYEDLEGNATIQKVSDIELGLD